MDKKETRQELILKRKNIDKREKIIYDKKISDLIIGTSFFEQARNVLVFASTSDEFDTKHIVKECRDRNKKVFYPRCSDKLGNMDFFEVNCDDDLSIGLFGIFEPMEKCKKYVPEQNDIVIVPALSVDSRFYRIGYGRGYYDRFLKDFRGVSFCPCYDEMLTDILPADEFDIKINVLVTQRILRRSYCE
ncbi:MAG: 5-formyltetrahydrofolate cyclo-ligase [Candidatus Fimenecus sp.]